MIIHLKFIPVAAQYTCTGGGRLAPEDGRLAHIWGHFRPKVALFLRYHIFHNENVCKARIQGVFGHELISKSFIHWLLRYEPGFLGWASCPMLPYSVKCTYRQVSNIRRTLAIQIKICAEYRDMLPRPRLVCQEPGLRPIGRSPGVPDKSSRGLGSMSRYSAQILICFIAYIFSIFNFSVGLVGNLAELPPCTVPPATVHCYQNEAAQCSSDNQISQHALLRGSRKKHSLAFMPQNWWN